MIVKFEHDWIAPEFTSRSKRQIDIPATCHEIPFIRFAEYENLPCAGSWISHENVARSVAAILPGTEWKLMPVVTDEDLQQGNFNLRPENASLLQVYHHIRKLIFDFAKPTKFDSGTKYSWLYKAEKYFIRQDSPVELAHHEGLSLEILAQVLLKGDDVIPSDEAKRLEWIVARVELLKDLPMTMAIEVWECCLMMHRIRESCRKTGQCAI